MWIAVWIAKSPASNTSSSDNVDKHGSSSSPTDSPPPPTSSTLAWTEPPATSHHHQRRRHPRHHRQCSRKRRQLRANQQHSTILRQGAKPKIIFHCCRNFLDWSWHTRSRIFLSLNIYLYLQKLFFHSPQQRIQSRVNLIWKAKCCCSQEHSQLFQSWLTWVSKFDERGTRCLNKKEPVLLEELRMLSRSLSDCQSLTLNVMIR